MRKYAFVLAFIANLILIAGMYYYVGYSVNKNNQRWCALTGIQIEPDPNAPRLVPGGTGSKIVKELSNLHNDIGCK